MKKNFSRQIKFPRIIDDWTKLRPDTESFTVGLSEIENTGFDALPKERLEELHNLHYYFINDILEKFKTDLELSTQTRSIDAHQLFTSNNDEIFGQSTIHFQIKLPGFGNLAVLLDSMAASAIINRLMGGKGDPEPKIEFTDIECDLINHYMSSITPIVKQLWPCLDESVKIETFTGTQVHEQMDNFPKNGSYVVFEAKYDFNKDVTQQISLIYPTSTLSKLISESLSSYQKTIANISLNKETLNKIKVPVTVNIGSTHIDMNDINALEPGDIIQLDQTLDSPIYANIGGGTSLKGQIIQQNGRYAISLLEQSKFPNNSNQLSYLKSTNIVGAINPKVEEDHHPIQDIQKGTDNANENELISSPVQDIDLKDESLLEENDISQTNHALPEAPQDELSEESLSMELETLNEDPETLDDFSTDSESLISEHSERILETDNTSVEFDEVDDNIIDDTNDSDTVESDNLEFDLTDELDDDDDDFSWDDLDDI